MLFWCILFHVAFVVDSLHFNGGIIRWEPLDPYTNSSSVAIIITQTYSWAYPTITCANNVPITTSGRSGENSNLICVVDCSTDGNYSAKPINILTDCVSTSTSLGMMTSQRTNNVTLSADAHFYVGYVGTAWRSLGYPLVSGLEWSIITYIDLRKRPDGFINTPPIVTVISPQYVIVNQTTQINIPVSDINLGDSVRCRWATYTPGYRRRRLAETRSDWNHKHTYRQPNFDIKRIKRAGATSSPSVTTSSTTDTTGTLRSTSLYPNRQAIDECGGICYPNTLPSGTSLTDCTITFTGTIAGIWYGAAIQVEDFINSTSTNPMSSVPVQFLIYVLPTPSCFISPLILFSNATCMEVSIGVPKVFNITVLNYCDPQIIPITDISANPIIEGLQQGNLTNASSNASLSYVTFTWTPQLNQRGKQVFCFTAYTSERVQSALECITFWVLDFISNCQTTTTSTTTTSSTTSRTSTTSTTSTTTTTTSRTTTTTSSATSSTSTTTSATTSTSVTTTSATTSTTSTSTTSSTSTSTSTSTTSTTTTVTSSTTSSTSTTTSTRTTTSSTSATTATTASVTTSAITTVLVNIDGGNGVSTSTIEKGPSWGLIGGLISLVLPLGLCSICCLYRLLWSPSARLRTRKEDEEDIKEEEAERYLDGKYHSMSTNTIASTAITTTTANTKIDVPAKSFQIYSVHETEHQSQTQTKSSISINNAREKNRMETTATRQQASSSAHGHIQSNFMSFSNASFNMTLCSQTERPEDDSGSIEHSIETHGNTGDFTKWARRYLYGFDSRKSSA